MGGEAVHFSIRHEPFDVALLLPGEGPKALADWKSRVRAFEVLGGERFPRRPASFFRDAPHRRGSSMWLSSKPCANAPW
jgi:hypothetical protein